MYLDNIFSVHWFNRFTTVPLKALSDEVDKDIHVFLLKADYFPSFIVKVTCKFPATETMEEIVRKKQLST